MTTNINRIGVLYRDLLSSTLKPLSQEDRSLLLNIQPKNKIVAIGDIDLTNWNSYPLTYLLDRKLVAPTVLDESKVYQSIQAMRTHNESIMHPQHLISQSVVVRIIGLDSSSGINDYLNTFISMCIAADHCKCVFVIFDGDKKFYKNIIYTRKSNSTFIDNAIGAPYKIESVPLMIQPDDIIYFNHSKKFKSSKSITTNKVSSVQSNHKNSCTALLDDPDLI